MSYRLNQTFEDGSIVDLIIEIDNETTWSVPNITFSAPGLCGAGCDAEYITLSVNTLIIDGRNYAEADFESSYISLWDAGDGIYGPGNNGLIPPSTDPLDPNYDPNHAMLDPVIQAMYGYDGWSFIISDYLTWNIISVNDKSLFLDGYIDNFGPGYDPDLTYTFLPTNSDYTISAVPIPASILLFGSGLLGLIVISRGKKVDAH
jgi:hypothetical protein